MMGRFLKLMQVFRRERASFFVGGRSLFIGVVFLVFAVWFSFPLSAVVLDDDKIQFTLGSGWENVSVGVLEVIGTANLDLSTTAPSSGVEFQGGADLRVSPTFNVSGVTESDGDVFVGGQVSESDGSNFSPVMPRGGVFLWSGLLSALPAGWVLCDGRSYPNPDGGLDIDVPDLRGFFVLGGTTANVTATGGALSHTHDLNPPLTSFSFSLGHQITLVGTIAAGTSGIEAGGGNSGGKILITDDDGFLGTDHEHAFAALAAVYSVTAPDSTVQINLPNLVSATASNLPPYYELAYIYKL